MLQAFHLLFFNLNEWFYLIYFFVCIISVTSVQIGFYCAGVIIGTADILSNCRATDAQFGNL